MVHHLRKEKYAVGASDCIVLDDPRGPSNLLSCQKLCVLDKFSLWIVCWPGGPFLMQSLLQSFCYGDNECLLSSHVKCSEVCFEKGVWVLFFLNYFFFLFFVTYGWHRVMYQLAACLLQCCRSSVIQGNEFWKAPSCSLVCCVYSANTCASKRKSEMSAPCHHYISSWLSASICVYFLLE